MVERTISRLPFVVLGAVLVIAGCSRQQDRGQAGGTPEAVPAAMTHDQLVARGRYLVTISGCNDCHSPKVFNEQGMFPDSTRMLSGHPADSPLPGFDPASVGPGKWVLFNDDFTACVGPWGAVCAQNLTPDMETGIGSWPEAMFIQALRTGKHLGSGRPIMPPMPWPNLAQASDEDLKAIFAYLKTLPPIHNKVQGPIPWPELMARK